MPEEAYFKKFDTAWKSYFDQSPDVWLLQPGNNTENSMNSIDSLAHAELQLSEQSMIHAHMLKKLRHFTKIHLNVEKTWRRPWASTFMLIIKSLAAAKRTLIT